MGQTAKKPTPTTYVRIPIYEFALIGTYQHPSQFSVATANISGTAQFRERESYMQLHI